MLILQSQIYKTGSGQVEYQSTSISNKFMGIMGIRFQSLKNAYDRDGGLPETPTNKTYYVETLDIPDIQRNDGDGSLCKLLNSLKCSDDFYDRHIFKVKLFST